MQKSVKLVLTILIFLSIVLLGVSLVVLVDLDGIRFLSFVILAIAYYTAKWFYNKQLKVDNSSEEHE